jgi:SRSO17 transposase
VSAMKRRQPEAVSSAEPLQSYLGALTLCAGHADHVVPMQNYAKGLLAPGAQSIEPMAARLAPCEVRRMHQSLHHVVAQAACSDEALLEEVRRQVLPAITVRDLVVAWIVDDAGLPKKGSHSVGVVRQYCRQVGEQENCQVAVSVSLDARTTSLPATYRLYLPEIWANNPQLREKTGVPEGIRFQAKPEIALDQNRALADEELPRGVVLAVAAYGTDHDFREQLEGLPVCGTINRLDRHANRNSALKAR